MVTGTPPKFTEIASDLTIFQGASHSVIAIAGSDPSGVAVNNIADHMLGFGFDDTATPQYTTVASSAYVTNLAALDFAADPVLKLAAPTAPDMTTIDDGACTAPPTTVLNFVAKSEDNAVFSAAKLACNVFPAENSGNMCDLLRQQEHDVNDAMHDRKAATGSATN